MIASRKLDSCEQLARQVERTTGRNALAVAYHAGSWDDSNRLAEVAYQQFGKVDVLVNNAGMSPLYKSVDTITEELYDKVLDVNLKGTMLTTREFLPDLFAQPNMSMVVRILLFNN